MIRQRLFNIATVVSLIICVAAMIGWIRSRQHRDAYRFQWHRVAYAIASIGGCIVIDNEPQRADFARVQHPHSKIVSASKTTDVNGVRIHSITVEAYSFPAPPPLFSQTVCYDWMIVTATAILPFIAPFRWAIREDRTKNGACANCGYNLTANVSGVCPECGTAIRTSPEASA